MDGCCNVDDEHVQDGHQKWHLATQVSKMAVFLSKMAIDMAMLRKKMAILGKNGHLQFWHMAIHQNPLFGALISVVPWPIRQGSLP